MDPPVALSNGVEFVVTNGQQTAKSCPTGHSMVSSLLAIGRENGPAQAFGQECFKARSIDGGGHLYRTAP